MTSKTINILKIAQEEHYAIPAFNFSDVWELLAILQAAEEARAFVYLATNMKVIEAMGYGFASALGRQASVQLGGNAILHLDHCKDPAECCKAIDAGYMSVMIDASTCELEDNIAKTNLVTGYAHQRGILVEAELGKIMGNTMEGTFTGGEFLADTDECVRLVAETGVDSLAVGIGNAHGFYKAPPKLNIQRLREIRAAVDVPLVLHGGTGLPEAQVRACIESGISKVNVGTLLHSTYLTRLRAELDREWSGYNIMDRFEAVREDVKNACAAWIRLCGASGRV